MQKPCLLVVIRRLSLLMERKLQPWRDAKVEYFENKNRLGPCRPPGFRSSICGRRSCSRGYTIILLFGMVFINVESCADAEPRVNTELFHPPHEFRDFINLLAADFAAKLFKESAASRWINLSWPCRATNLFTGTNRFSSPSAFSRL